MDVESDLWTACSCTVTFQTTWHVASCWLLDGGQMSAQNVPFGFSLGHSRAPW